MKNRARGSVLAAFLGITCATWAQRYATEVFDDAQLLLVPDVSYGMNIDFMASDLSDQEAIMGELLQLQYFVANGVQIPPVFFQPEEPGTLVKLIEPRMDVYEPDPLVDCEEQRPLFIYLHAGDGLPPPLNHRPFGSRKDSSAVLTCMRMARRGYVAVSLDYRLGWWADAVDIDSLRGSWVNELYRGVHDLRQGIRALKAAAPEYLIDVEKVIVCGEGFGAQIALAAATLDDPAELYVPSFLPDASVADSSYIDTTMAGDLEGFNGLMTLYRPNGYTSDLQFCASIGGALADTSWLGAGDPPLVSFHAAFDPRVPYADGVLLSRPGNAPVIPLHGPRLFQSVANAWGINAQFTGFPDGEALTDRARALYGTSQSHQGSSVDIGEDVEGLFPFVTADWPAGDPALEEEGSPWSWWDPQDPIAQVEVAPGITAGEAELAGNPNMSAEKGRACIDTIIGYMNPRIIAVLGLTDELIHVGLPCDDGDPNSINDVYNANCICAGIVDGIADIELARELSVRPNPAQDVLLITSGSAIMRSYELLDLTGRPVRSAVVNAASFRMDRGDLEAGTYVLSVRSAMGRASRKVVLD